jgi:hypothetical protein
MKERFLLLLFFFGFSATFSQVRRNAPLLSFSSVPIGQLDEGIAGWVRTTNGQWISSENTIPKRFSSFDEKKYKQKHNKLGMDNIQAIEVYDVTYGDERLWAIVKYYTNGAYKYKGTQKGWKDWDEAYYYLVYPEEFQKLSELEDSIIHVIKFKLLHSGRIRDVKRDEIADEIQRKVKFTQTFDRYMVLHLRLDRGSNKAHFQFACPHEIFGDIEGVLNDFTVKGKSLYGRPALFDYFYYETTMFKLGQVFPIL